MNIDPRDAGSPAAAPRDADGHTGVERPRRGRALKGTLAVTLVLLLVAVEWAIRVGEPKVAPTTGVDTLGLPWPDPAPADFVAGVDHEWMPFGAGDRWEYATGLAGDGLGAAATLEVLDEPVPVAGIATTAVQWTLGENPSSTLLVAQDRRGHLWLLGVRAGRLTGSWSVEDGHPAGLLLPAEPRRGDGHGVAHERDGTVRVRATIQEISGPDGEAQPVTVGAGEFRDVLRVQWATAPVVDGEFPMMITMVLARGVGPVVVTPSTSQPLRLTATYEE